MFASFTLALFAASLVSAAPIRQTRDYAQDADILEPYATYSARYNAFGCENQHGNAFFDSCCHPLMKDAKADFPASCSATSSLIPTATATPTKALPTSAPAPTSTADDEECDDEPTSSIPAPTTSVIKNVEPTPTVVPHTSAAPSHTPETTIVETTPAPKPTPTPKPTTSSKEPEPTTSVKSSGGDGGALNLGGFATWFKQNGVAGACGTVHGENDLIVAIDEARYGNSGEKSSLCGKQVKITNKNNNKSVVATIADDCPTCVNNNSIDLSQGTFQSIASLDDGMVPIAWSFV